MGGGGSCCSIAAEGGSKKSSMFLGNDLKSVLLNANHKQNSEFKEFGELQGKFNKDIKTQVDEVEQKIVVLNNSIEVVGEDVRELGKYSGARIDNVEDTTLRRFEKLGTLIFL